MDKKIIKYISLFSFLFFIIPTNAQELNYESKSYINKYTISTPDVYNFEKYSLTNVDKYVGAPAISIPIYNIKSGGIEYPINLSYDPKGIKVDQRASNVGLGWNVTKTIITRVINQQNDFNNLGKNYLDNQYQYEINEQQHEFEASKESGYIGYFLAKNRSLKMEGRNTNIDFLPDTYHLYAPEFNTEFFFIEPNKAIEIQNQSSVITGKIGKRVFNTEVKAPFEYSPYLYNFPTQDFFSLSVTNNKGIKYVFNDYDVSVEYIHDTSKKYFPPAQVSAWHISEIEDLNTGKKIFFEYEDYSTNTIGSSNIELRNNAVNKSYQYTKNPEYEDLECIYYFDDAFPHRYDLNITEQADVILKKLRKIVFEEGYVEFQYNVENEEGVDTTPRLDVHNGIFVSKIVIYNNNNDIVNSFDFGYSYFESDYGIGEFNPYPSIDFKDYRYKRLKLESVKPMGLPSYKFIYDESAKLPPINSFSVDFLGYYNASPDINSIENLKSLRLSPTMYYRPNQFGKSLLPFPSNAPGEPIHTIPGYFSRRANNYSKTWSLIGIKYPTGGKANFIYESNTFNIDGNTINGGGIRIKEQHLDDGFGNIRKLKYEYTNRTNNRTSGTLSSLPYFGHPTIKFFDVSRDENGVEQEDFDNLGNTSNNIKNWKIFDKSNLNADITSGAYVGYSRVVEREEGRGYTESFYTSNDVPEYRNRVERTERWLNSQTNLVEPHYLCITNFLIMNSGIGTNIFTDNSYMRGKLLEENVYNEGNDLLKKTKIAYENRVSNIYLYNQPINQPIKSLTEDNTKHLMTSEKKYTSHAFLVKNKEISMYSTSDINNARTDYASYYYNEDNSLRMMTGVNSQGHSKLTKYYYPRNITAINSLPSGSLGSNLTNSELAAINKMKNPDLNNVFTPVQIERYNNDDYLVSRERILFKEHEMGVVPSDIKLALTDRGSFNNIVKFDKYESSSNLLEMTQKVDDKTIFIWGYNNTKIVAKIENYTSYDQIPSQLIINIKEASNSSDEQLLLNALNNLRNHNSMQSSLVTTYTYKPLVGISSITEPNGLRITYYYDQFNRLQYVKDHLGNILSENEYHYKQL